MEGPPGFVRCLAYEVEERDPWSVGELEIRLEERVLHILASADALRVAAFAGPGPGPVRLSSLVTALEEQPVDILLMVGGLGDSVSIAQQTLAALEPLTGLTLILAGGRDDVEVWGDAWDSLSNEEEAEILDARGIAQVRFRGAGLILVSGAPGGRYARTDTSCGFTPEDVEDLADELGSPSGPRSFVSWAAPAGMGHAFGGLDVGSRALMDLADEAEIRGGIFAWPRALGGQEARSEGGEPPPSGERFHHRFVERLGGLPVLRGDGSLALGRLARFRLDSAGLHPVISTP